MIELTADFNGSLVEYAVPLDARALSALKHSALALDVYSWLAHRLHRVKSANGTRLSWCIAVWMIWRTRREHLLEAGFGPCV